MSRFSVWAVVFVCGCGGSGSSDLFQGGSGSVDVGPSPGSSSVAVSPNVPSAGSDAGLGGGSSDATVPDASANDASTVDSGIGDTGNGRPDARPDAGPDRKGRVRCGGASCATPATFCCVDENQATPTSCVASGDPCAGATFECDNRGDCPPLQVCCATRADTGDAYTGTQCRANCRGGEVDRLCDPDALLNECATRRCEASDVSGYYRCN